MPSRNAPSEMSRDNFTEEELDVISQALREFIERRAEIGEACPECGEIGEDDDVTPQHSEDCPAAIANGLFEKLGIEAPE